MIVKGKPEQGLQKHQQEAYRCVEEAYKNSNKASVVIPTGCGKSFIALQLMVDNRDKRILFMAPTIAIKNQMYNYIAKYVVGEEKTNGKTSKMIAEEYFPNLKIMLYPSLLKLKDEQMEKLNADIIIMDELHRTGADKWGEKVNVLLEKNNNAKILGLTATPDRMDDKNVVDDLFEGNINYELTLVDALRYRIVKSPEYVKCDYALQEYLEGIKIAIDNCSNEQSKKILQEKFDRMRKIVEHADGIPELFAKNIKKKDGKYIVFCKSKEHMDELMSKAKEWFKAIDDNPQMYSVFSGKGYTKEKNKKTLEDFENSKSEHIKLLFCVEMLNEGLHIEDISGVIMARPTDSKIIYLQQLGRVLSSDTSRDKTIVFDLVNNYLKNNLDAEINKREVNDRNVDRKNNITIGKNENDEFEDIDTFRIQGETKEFLELIYEVNGIIKESSYLINAKKIKEWIEKSGDTIPPNSKSKDEEEKKLGTALARIRCCFIKPYLELRTEEERKFFKQKYPEIDTVLEIINEIDKNNNPTYLKSARKIKEWIEKSGDTIPPSGKSKNEVEKKLGQALSRIRKNLIKPYLELRTEQEKKEFRNKNQEIDEVLEIIKEIDKNNIPTYLRNIWKIREWIDKSGNTIPPNKNCKNEEEKKLGIALFTIRKRLIRPFLELKTEEGKNIFRNKHPEIDEVLEIVRKIDINSSPLLRNVKDAREWIKNSGGTKPPTENAKDKEEKRLGTSLGRIKREIIKPYLELQTKEEKDKFKEKYPEVDEMIQILNEIDRNYVPISLDNAIKIRQWIEESKDKKIPSSSSKNKEERKLGTAVYTIINDLIKPYLELKTQKERKIYEERHLKINEIIQVITEVYIEYGNDRQKELAVLIRQDVEKGKNIQKENNKKTDKQVENFDEGR